MRFEQMEFERKIKTMRKFHKRINRDFFNGKLKNIALDIANTNKGQMPDNVAMFTPSALSVNRETLEASFVEKISFAHEFIEIIAEQKTQREQAFAIATVMLHEMIHQYCYENGLDDENHSGEWEKTAYEHGLISIYRNGKLIEEYARPATEWIISLYGL